MEDSNFIHTAKETPAWIIITPILLVLIAIIVFADLPDAVLAYMTRTADGFGGALLLSLNARRSGTTVNTDAVNTDTVQTESMPNAQIQTEKVETK